MPDWRSEEPNSTMLDAIDCTTLGVEQTRVAERERDGDAVVFESLSPAATHVDLTNTRMYGWVSRFHRSCDTADWTIWTQLNLLASDRRAIRYAAGKDGATAGRMEKHSSVWSWSALRQRLHSQRQRTNT